MGITSNETYKSDRLYKAVLTILLGVSVFLFWAFPYKSALSYQEQFQLFLTTASYFKEAISIPGGLAKYVGEYIVQFYFMPTIGALFVSLMVAAIQILTYRIAKKMKKEIQMTGYLLSFIPSIMIWLYMGDENALLPFYIAAIPLLLAIFLFVQISKLYHRLILSVLFTIVCYWFFGTIVYSFVLFAVLFEIFKKSGVKHAIITALTLSLTVVATIIVTSNLISYPIDRLFNDIVYYRIPTTVPLMQYAIMVLLALMPFICQSEKIRHNAIVRYEKSVDVAIILANAILIYGGVKLFYDAKKYELIDYDCMVRTNNWQGIIKKATEKQPDLPLSVCATNLALGMTGQLCDKAFSYYQNGVEGLLPRFKRDPNSLLTTAEVYFLLGLANTAERFYFEAMEGIPNYAKSGRCMKRIAETNLLNGQYEVAEKYLKILENTLFYKKWARQTLVLMRGEKAIDKHPFYGNMKKNQLANDYLFSEEEADKILGQLFIKNQDNQLAMQYILLYPLLQRDTNKFMQYLSVVQQKRQFNPTICQQGVAFAYMQINQPIPQNAVSPMITDEFKRFASIVTSEGKQSQRLSAYKNTLWYYLLIGNRDQK